MDQRGQQAVASALAARARRQAAVVRHGEAPAHSPRVMGMAGAMRSGDAPATHSGRPAARRAPPSAPGTDRRAAVRAWPARPGRTSAASGAAASGSMAMTSRYMPPAMPSTRLCVPMRDARRARLHAQQLEMAGAAVQVRGGDDDVIDDEFHGAMVANAAGSARYSGAARGAVQWRRTRPSGDDADSGRVGAARGGPGSPRAGPGKPGPA